MNAPLSAQAHDNNDFLDKFTHADPAIRSIVVGIWISILLESYRGLVKELQDVANYTASFVEAKKTSCQQKFLAWPEYSYVLQHGDAAQIKYIQDLLESIHTPPQPPRYVEPVTLIRPTIEELRRRVSATLAEVS